MLSFEAQAGNLVDIGKKDVEKLFKHWKEIVTNTGELEFPDDCSGVFESTRELVNQSTKTITFFNTEHKFTEPKWVSLKPSF